MKNLEKARELGKGLLADGARARDADVETPEDVRELATTSA